MLPEIKLFSQVNASTRGVRDAIMTLVNGTVLTNFDEVWDRLQIITSVF